MNSGVQSSEHAEGGAIVHKKHDQDIGAVYTAHSTQNVSILPSSQMAHAMEVEHDDEVIGDEEEEVMGIGHTHKGTSNLSLYAKEGRVSERKLNQDQNTRVAFPEAYGTNLGVPQEHRQEFETQGNDDDYENYSNVSEDVDRINV